MAELNDKRMLIFLTGFMGSGKSSIGRKLAYKLGFNFIDLDELIEHKTGKRIAAIFKEDGEGKFRQIEHGCLKDTFSYENSVIATGGGTPCFYNNMELINRYGISVYIKLNPGILASRLFSDKENRPLIKKYSDKRELQLFVEDCLGKREKFYLQSKFTVEGKDISAKKIIEKLSGAV